MRRPGNRESIDHVDAGGTQAQDPGNTHSNGHPWVRKEWAFFRGGGRFPRQERQGANAHALCPSIRGLSIAQLRPDVGDIKYEECRWKMRGGLQGASATMPCCPRITFCLVQPRPSPPNTITQKVWGIHWGESDPSLGGHTGPIGFLLTHRGAERGRAAARS